MAQAQYEIQVSGVFDTNISHPQLSVGQAFELSVVVDEADVVVLSNQVRWETFSFDFTVDGLPYDIGNPFTVVSIFGDRPDIPRNANLLIQGSNPPSASFQSNVSLPGDLPTSVGLSPEASDLLAFDGLVVGFIVFDTVSTGIVGDGAISVSRLCGDDDAFEDNDDCASAVPIPAGLTSELQAVDADADFYTFTVPAGEVLTAAAGFSHDSADIDMNLFDAGCGSLLDSSSSATDSESVTWANDTGAPADVTIEVFVAGGSGCSVYEIDISTEDPCVSEPDDLAEDNDDCTSASPAVAGVTPAFVRKGDDDWYRITVPPATTLYAQAIFEHASADIDMLLVDDCSGAPLSSSTSATDNEQVTYVNTTAAPVDALVLAEVFSASAGNCTTYDLVISFENGMPGAPYCSATPNSTGLPANMSATGSSSIAANDLVTVAGPVPSGVFGIFFHGRSQASFPFQGTSKIQCTNAPVRGRPRPAVGSNLTVPFNNLSPVNAAVVFQGATRHFQAWFRDGQDPDGFGLSDGYSVTFTE